MKKKAMKILKRYIQKQQSVVLNYSYIATDKLDSFM